MEFDDALFQAETSRMCQIERPRWWVVGTEGGFTKHGLDPQEDALRAGDLSAASEPLEHRAVVRTLGAEPTPVPPPVRGGWDAYYANIADHLLRGARLAVTAEEGREVVRVLEAAVISDRERRVVEGPWGLPGDAA
jgi:scyllo-inositol 2-dehydrogenase (NADP+)